MLYDSHVCVCVCVWLLPPPLLVGKCCYDSELSAISCGHVCPNDNDAVQVITITTFRLVNLTFGSLLLLMLYSLFLDQMNCFNSHCFL